MKALYGLIANPVGHSMSPDIHNAALKDAGIDGHYHGFQVEENDLADAISGMKALGISGFNVTVPHKVEIMQYLDKIDVTAERLRAVNTVRLEKGQLVGYNTDGEGFLHSLLEALDQPLSELSFLMIGAGGAARAIYTTIADYAPKRFDISNRTIEKAEALIQSADGKVTSSAIALNTAEDRLGDYDVIIHTTSIGMYPNVEETPISLTNAKKTAVVCDIVYNPIETKLLSEAAGLGLKTVDGVGMFVGQAARAFELWTGITPDIEKMKSIVIEKLGGTPC
ncbi:shikimate dehydrogenase [Bacillus zhangzhouensis]|uniref:Shikimate dehydrogenase (NADP(+)) n=1 Tax=Bacillus zhangzhouensis TaxID=1178540 RepID=A0A081LCP4_9BACI|nr:shikimate dehydrogenase [Bacillus zhangzhouensis]KEP27020.1 shikimate dehydrogenase [Bacillus zhangzhouensis]MDR0126824.1 shikimate dehydrogenase [Bacillus zhangzhouensis]